MAESPQGSYQFAQQPRAVSGDRKYRDPSGFPGQDRYAVNIMWDRRVVRGNTYSAQVLPASTVQDEHKPTSSGSGKFRAPALTESRKRSRGGTGKTGQSPNETMERPEGPPESMLEEITDRPIDIEPETVVQRDENRPPSPIFVPQQQGVDAETQVEDGDLFDFDVEVEPILETLIGTVLMKGLEEVVEEDKIFEEQIRKYDFECLRAAELAEAERLEEARHRRNAEQERREQQENDRLEAQKTAVRKVAARGFAHLYVGDVVSSVFGTLEETGFFYDPLVREIEDTFMPWLFQGVQSNMANAVEKEKNAEAILAGVLDLREERAKQSRAEYDEMLRKQEEEAAALAAAKAQAEAEAAAAAEAAATAEAEGAEGEAAAE